LSGGAEPRNGGLCRLVVAERDRRVDFGKNPRAGGANCLPVAAYVRQALAHDFQRCRQALVRRPVGRKKRFTKLFDLSPSARRKGLGTWESASPATSLNRRADPCTPYQLRAKSPTGYSDNRLTMSERGLFYWENFNGASATASMVEVEDSAGLGHPYANALILR
jgi:hypothetical protein